MEPLLKSTRLIDGEVKGIMDNVKQKSKQSRRPDGHSFQAVKILKEKFDGDDNFLIYDYNDGSDGNSEFVVKSSRLKVNFLLNLKKK